MSGAPASFYIAMDQMIKKLVRDFFCAFSNTMVDVRSNLANSLVRYILNRRPKIRCNMSLNCIHHLKPI